MKGRFWKYLSLIVVVVMALGSIAAAPLDQKTQAAATVVAHGDEDCKDLGHWDKQWVPPQPIYWHGRIIGYTPGYWKPVWISDVVCKPEPKSGCYIDKDWKEQCPKPGCYFAPQDDPKDVAEVAGHKPPEPPKPPKPEDKKPQEVCPGNQPAYPNFQNDICTFCADPLWSELVPRELQDPKVNEVTKKEGGVRGCAISDETHNGKNDAGFWIIENGQWVLKGGDYYAQSKFTDWYALPSTPFCAAFTDKDPYTGKILSVDANGKAVQVMHPAVLEKNGFIWIRTMAVDDAVMLYGTCKAGDVYNEKDLGVTLRRLRDGADKEHPVKVKEYTSPNGRPYWDNR